jgi:hypothetical protein
VPRAKPIKCPTELDGCGSTCLEIRTHGYPKAICEPNLKKVYNEYRYVCPNCGMEWLYHTSPRGGMIEDIPEAEFRFGKDGKILSTPKEKKDAKRDFTPDFSSCPF